MKKVYLCLLVVLLMCSYKSFADTPPLPPSSYSLELDGYTFFMTPAGQEDDVCLKSGLYRNTDPAKAVYYVTTYVYSGELFLSGDGMQYAVMPWWLSSSRYSTGSIETSEPAVVFYSRGRQTKLYRLSDLSVDYSTCHYSVSHLMWDEQEERVLDREHNTLSVLTRWGKSITFDLTTGAIVDEKSTKLAMLSVYGCLVICTWLVIYVIRKREAHLKDR